MAWLLDVVDVADIPGIPLSSFVAGAPASEQLSLPCLAFLLTRGDDTILVDTGPDPRLAHRAGFHVTGQPSRRLRAVLKRRGRGPDDVRLVIHTHLHYDHIQNDVLFPRASVLVQQAELEWAGSPTADAFCVGIREWESGLRGQLQVVDSEGEVASGLRLVPTRGHTPGHQAVLVSTDEGWVCVAGDEVPLTASMDEPPPAAWDASATRTFLERAHREHWRLLPSHDPSMRSGSAAGSGMARQPDSGVSKGIGRAAADLGRDGTRR